MERRPFLSVNPVIEAGDFGSDDQARRIGGVMAEKYGDIGWVVLLRQIGILNEEIGKPEG